MRRVVPLLLVLQVLVCTVGQGALTLCVRRDGTQRIEWTAHSACHAHHEQEAVCSCCESDEPAEQVACDFCTDYLLVAPVAPPLSHGMPELFDCYALCPVLSDWDVSSLHHLAHLSLHGPPPWHEPVHLAVPLRC
jgi:hypothetical protein